MKKIISVDVQPAMQNYITFYLSDFVEYLNKEIDKGRKILYFYLGSDLGYEDNNVIIIDWLLNYGLEIKSLENIEFVEKDYGWFRDWMEKFDEEEIIEAIKILINNDLNDCRDNEELFKKFDINCDELPIYINDYVLKEIRNFVGNDKSVELIGGGENECLKEIELLLKAIDIQADKNYNFIY